MARRPTRYCGCGAALTVQGLVQDGLAGLDATYSAMPATHALHWFGFYDPHSPLVRRRHRISTHAQDFFEWCAGTAQGLCDQIAWTKVYLVEEVSDIH